MLKWYIFLKSHNFLINSLFFPKKMVHLLQGSYKVAPLPERARRLVAEIKEIIAKKNLPETQPILQRATKNFR